MDEDTDAEEREPVKTETEVGVIWWSGGECQGLPYLPDPNWGNQGSALETAGEEAASVLLSSSGL